MSLLRDRVQRGTKVRFTHCCDGELWYEDEEGFAFPVPIGDITRFFDIDDESFFMYYASKHMDMIEVARRGGNYDSRFPSEPDEPKGLP